MYKGKVYVSNCNELKNALLKKMNNVPYAGYPGCQKTIVVVRSQCFWPGMKE